MIAEMRERKMVEKVFYDFIHFNSHIFMWLCQFQFFHVSLLSDYYQTELSMFDNAVKVHILCTTRNELHEWMRWVTRINDKGARRDRVECGWWWWSRINVSREKQKYTEEIKSIILMKFPRISVFFLFSVLHFVEFFWTLNWMSSEDDVDFPPFSCFIVPKTRQVDAMAASKGRNQKNSHFTWRNSTIQQLWLFHIMNKFHDFLFLFQPFHFRRQHSTFSMCYCVVQGFQGKRYIVVHFKKLYFIFIRWGNKM